MEDEIQVFGTEMREALFVDTLREFFGNYDFEITYEEGGGGMDMGKSHDSITITFPEGNAKAQDVDEDELEERKY
tara:strand:- start:1892 stop:2116 length:225 start_codon:yes stop_codon:yes gene_type:complete